MSELPGDLHRRIDKLAADRTSGATDILEEVIALLVEARDRALPMRTVARSVCAAQPTMAAVWNAVLAALSPDQDRLTQFTERIRRAPAALSRFAAAHFGDDRDQTLRIVTISFSRSVLLALDAIRGVRPIRVSCTESRPAFEGRGLAAELAAAGVAVTLFGDAAIAHALGHAVAVLLGADAIAPTWFLNKSGTRMLAAAASQWGVPVYVVATRDKFVTQELGARLVVREGDATEIWSKPPRGVQIRNPYFESTPIELITSVISDVGVLGAGMLPEVCAAATGDVAPQLLDHLG